MEQKQHTTLLVVRLEDSSALFINFISILLRIDVLQLGHHDSLELSSHWTRAFLVWDEVIINGCSAAPRLDLTLTLTLTLTITILVFSISSSSTSHLFQFHLAIQISSDCMDLPAETGDFFFGAAMLALWMWEWKKGQQRLEAGKSGTPTVLQGKAGLYFTTPPNPS
ncbi:hypothetical protein VE03_10434 [Pseudogymnoascus sp. 23342-1-I1]|nr:hypothetical protein VE03_10434 [Pseudogymnoascus sp. 23342-1-I1]